MGQQPLSFSSPQTTTSSAKSSGKSSRFTPPPVVRAKEKGKDSKDAVVPNSVIPQWKPSEKGWQSPLSQAGFSPIGDSSSIAMPIQGKSTLDRLSKPNNPEGDRTEGEKQTPENLNGLRIQRHGGHHHDDDDDDKIHRKAEKGGSFEADGNIENRLKSEQGRGKPLDAEVRSFMEPRFGSSFAHVNVHTGSEAVQMNRDLHAHAFTHGSDIYFNQGQYNPESSSGKALLAHELTHTIQQTGGIALQPQEEDAIDLQRQAKTGNHDKSCTCPDCAPGSIQRQTLSTAHGNSCACETCVGGTIQRQSDRTGNLLGENLLQRITQNSGNLQRQAIGHGMGCFCPTCTPGIQAKLTVGAPDDQYEQEADRTAKRVMRMSDLQSLSLQSSSESAQCQNHDHEEDIAQTKPLSRPQGNIAQRQAIAAQVTTTSRETIQRHSSHEHYLLGSSSPDDLEDISIMRELGALSKKMKKKGSTLADVDIEKSKEFEKKYASIKHTIQQHINLLKNFIETPDFLETKENRTAKDGTELDPGEIYKPEEATDWEIPYISLPVKKEKGDKAASDSMVVMYGELNALPDFFGSPLDIADTPKENVIKLVQGIRQRVYKNLLHWYNDEIVQSEEEKIKDETKKGKGDFKGAAGPKYADKTEANESYFNDVSKRSGGSNGLIVENEADNVSKVDKDPDQKYFAALERNACHFAPDSWNAWKKYHEQALETAEDANLHRLRRKSYEQNVEFGYGTITPKDVDEEKGEELKLNNKALLLNAFGDHFLQDSYAAGHLVDKTLIMAEFTKWLDKEDKLDALMPDDRALMARMIAGKMSEDDEIARKSEPQDFQDKIQSGKFFKEDEDEDEDTKKGPYEKAALSLGLPPDLPTIFLMWWRQKVIDKKVEKHARAIDLSALLKTDTPDKKIPTDPEVLEKNIIEPLKGLGFVKEKEDEFKQYSINKAILSQITGKKFGRSRKTPSYVSTVAKDTPEDYKELASEFNVQAYKTFMERTIIQTISNHFHDIYCRKGLVVHSRGGEKIGLIYGDKDMLSKKAGEGVKYASQTGKLSRNAVFKAAQGIMLSKEEQTNNIEKRFPGKVEVEETQYSLKDWNTKILATDENFQDAWDNNSKIKALRSLKKGRLSGGKLFAKIEEKPEHPGQLF